MPPEAGRLRCNRSSTPTDSDTECAPCVHTDGWRALHLFAALSALKFYSKKLTAADLSDHASDGVSHSGGWLIEPMPTRRSVYYLGDNSLGISKHASEHIRGRQLVVTLPSLYTLRLLEP